MAVGGSGGRGRLQVVWAVLGCAVVAVVIVVVVLLNECGMRYSCCCRGLTTCQNPHSISPAGLGFFTRDRLGRKDA